MRIETKLGKTIKDYKHCEEVGKIQYEQCADIIANVEDMNCDATDYKRYLKEYNAIESVRRLSGERRFLLCEKYISS